uniref:Uncharacterized protein n=1 Tax=Lactuca sativa TaxID=4236 RepID=A0A9R1XUB9_LACSA|nr:hypothetical protein LSAT_V11C100018940 [Lactuca sativa]
MSKFRCSMVIVVKLVTLLSSFNLLQQEVSRQFFTIKSVFRMAVTEKAEAEKMRLNQNSVLGFSVNVHGTTAKDVMDMVLVT